jgi:hypothetical protein
MVLNDAGDLWNGLSRVEEVDDGLALLHVAWQPDVVELSGFFVWKLTMFTLRITLRFTVFTVCTVHFSSSNIEYNFIFRIRYYCIGFIIIF